ncbi:glycosyltransferase family 4 protein [Acinetobacter bouvetii]|uniref:N, N'-diacetylbacillosaminyl-diphospho-undecaprenol alpha-1,3-N-acetylgalactosaminyltransferase n=1 Tax=Acinetobacter bouvetii TaxID=202951 RepID=A0A811GFE4_9GAMM|nr:glycosyltransferase family 4 protein [Acinetobacter bouvetii]CAB1220523.1 N, N'-diacetylbacillosaminyl-diphospho-undecaprenol alpha-1,3-N-acetylgalactosaminyltransferase [Acinetobacter bouvetii]
MRFLMICSYLPSALNFRGKLLEAIHAKGYEIHVFAPDLTDFPDELNRLQQLGYQVHAIPMQRAGTNPLADLKLLKTLYQMIRQIRPDVVLSYTIKPVIYGTLAAWLARVPRRFALITGLGYAFQNVESGQRSLFQKLVHGLYAQALKYADKVFFQNPDDLKLFQDMQLLDVNKPTVVVNGSGVNVQDFAVLPLPKNAQGQVKASFLLIARLLGDKGVREYAEAARIIKAQYPEVEFHLVGWIDDNPSAIAQAELDTWVADQTLKFWGKLSDVRPAIAASSVYVLPSYREGTPRTVLEAMAMGRAIITTDAPGCRETVTHGVNGYLVAVKSVDDLVSSMQYFIEDPKLMAYMGQRSREIALNKYDVHQVNKHMMTEMELI